MLDGHTNYRSFLKAKLAERITDNPSYSLRAMAKQMDLPPSLLCEVMKGSRNMTSNTASKAVEHFKLVDAEAEYFHLLVQLENESSPELRSQLMKRIHSLEPQGEIRDLTVDAFKSISDWYHLPILELTQVRSFEYSAKNIAHALGISAAEATAAIERLERLDLLEKSSTGKYRKESSRFVTNSPISNSAYKRFNRSYLEKASASLETQSPSERFSGSETFAFSAKLIPKAAEIAEEFFNRMIALANESPKNDEVYHLNVQLFRVTELKKQGVNK